MTIADNKKAFFDYFNEERYEAGIVLEGWEVKAIRANRVQIKEGYVVIRNAEMFLIGTHISPLQSASTHVTPDPVRTRKLLLKADEIKKLIGKAYGVAIVGPAYRMLELPEGGKSDNIPNLRKARS